MTPEHADAVDSSFSRQAAAFEDRRFNQVFATDVEWIFEHLACKPDHLALDVAGGTGHAARFLAPSVAAVLVVDLTVAMLEAGRIAAQRSDVRNVVFLRGDAACLPFPDASFDIVVSRFAVHHFENPGEQIAEMIRCLRPGGQVVVADLVADDDQDVARTHNRLERLRDPAHARLLTAGELRAALEDRGVAVTETGSREVQRPLAPWLAQTQVDDATAGAIGSALRSELDGGRPTGLRPRDRADELWFVQRFASVTARKPR